MRINSLVSSAVMAEDCFDLPPEESHHIARVLRAGPGLEMTVFDGRGAVAEVVIESVHKRAVSVRVLSRSFVPAPLVRVDLFQAVPKLERWELVLQKAVELGAAAIYPLRTQRTEFRPNDKQGDRWKKIVQHAAQQCEVRWLPELHEVMSLSDAMSLFCDYDALFIGSLYPGAKPFKEALGGGAGLKRVALLIGPEGDFTEEEVAQSVGAGATPVSFGSRILRTETAALYGLSVLAHELF
jgi:16S rRNA (uracil1498-N3)-methyltransferase